MTNPEEPSDNGDPEIESLLVGTPPDMQESIRGTVENLRSILSPEEWQSIRRAFVSDLKTYHEKKRIEQEMAEIKNEMQELEQDIKRLEELRKKLNSSNNGQAGK